MVSEPPIFRSHLPNPVALPSIVFLIVDHQFTMSLGSASSSTPGSSSSLNASISEKLTRDNFLIWQAQVLPDIRGA
jgi:hypothetical protein